MKRTSATNIVTTALLAVCVLLIDSRAIAEPISGDEMLNVPSSGATPKQEPNDAMALFKARDYEGSLKLWKEAASKNLDMPPAQVIMAQLFAQANMLEEARNALEQAAKDAPSDPEPYVLMAGLALRDGDPTKAESLFQKAGGLLSTFERSDKRKALLQLRLKQGLAMVAEARKDWAGAQKLLEELARQDPKNAALTQRIAFYLFQQKDVEGALGKLREAAKIEPAMLTPEAVLAQYYQRAGDRENVKKWMAAAVVAAPKNLRTRLAAGQRALGAGQLEEARKHAIAAMRLDPKSQQANLFRGAIAMFEKDYEAAESYFETALKQSPEEFNARNNLAVALIEQPDEGKNRRALDYAEANVKKHPKAVEAASTYAWVLYKLGRLDEAEKAVAGAASAVGSDLDVAYVAARIAVDRGQKAEAKKMLETALKLPAPALFRQEAEELLEQLKK